jgi:hypothetical protein
MTTNDTKRMDAKKLFTTSVGWDALFHPTKMEVHMMPPQDGHTFDNCECHPEDIGNELGYRILRHHLIWR